MDTTARSAGDLLNIAFLIQSLESGGAERQLALLASGLHKKGHIVTVLTLRSGGPYVGVLQQAGVAVRNLEKNGRWDVIGPVRGLTRIVRELKPDILHGYMPVANVFALLAGKVFAPTSVVFGVRSSNMDLDRYDALARWSYRVERFLARWADSIIANSTAGASIYRSRTANVPICVIPNGVDTDQFRVDPSTGPSMRRELGIDRDTRLVGLVARLDPKKNIEMFLDAAAQIRRVRPDVEFVIAGNGPNIYKQRLGDKAAAIGIAGQITWCAHQSDMAGLYNACDIVVLSSAFGEGFPNAIAEAMACGVRCVVTDVGEAARIVGDTGRVVPARHHDALAQAVLDLLAPDVAQALPDPRVRVIENFGVDKLIDRTTDALQQLLVDR